MLGSLESLPPKGSKVMIENTNTESLYAIYEAAGENSLSRSSLEELYYAGYPLGSKALEKIGRNK